MTGSSNKQIALSLHDVSKAYRLSKSTAGGDGSRVVKALDNVSFDIYSGECFALVGESGSGKTTTGRIIAGLEKADSGSIDFPLLSGEACSNGNELSLEHKQRDKERKGLIQFVFQDPFSSLDPRYSVRASIEEPLVVQGALPKDERKKKVSEIANAVGLSSEMLKKRPAQLSGGQRQRVNIARALVCDPALIVLDEPISALDVSVQAQVLNLLKDLQAEMGTTYLFISHDMSVVRFIADRVAVMKQGRIIEIAPTLELFDHPKHEYTQALLQAVPRR